MSQHKILVWFIFGLIITGVLLDLFINDSTLFIGGEFLFSFDYLAHLRNLFTNYLFNREEFLYQTQCRDCPIFYQMSSWYALWSLAIRAVGQIFGLNHLIFYLILTIIVQLLFLYLFVRLVFKPFNWFAFVTASIIFIFYPHKIFLVPSATLDGVIQGLIVGIIGISVYLTSKINTISFKKFLACSVGLGLLSSLFLNLAISHFPLIFYFLAGIFLWSLPEVLRNKNVGRLIGMYFIIVLISLLLNLPLIISQFSLGNLHNLTDYITLTFPQSISAGALFTKIRVVEVLAFFIILIALLLIAEISLKSKLFLVMSYLLLTWFLMGLPVGDYQLYKFIFLNFPFMEHMRGLYRFISFQLIIVFIIIYLGQLRLANNSRLRYFGFGISLILVFMLSRAFIHNFEVLQEAVLPPEYFYVSKYINKLDGKKIYFPLYSSFNNETMSGNYNWLEKKFFNPTIYTNPFTSLFFLPDLVFTEGYQLDNPFEQQLRALISYNRASPNDIISVLSYLGIRYLIIDKNYFWNINFPNFNLDELITGLDFERQFGQIYVYKLPDKSSECKKAYGDFMVGFCFEQDNPQHLVNKSAKDYFLEQQVLKKSKYLVDKNERIRVPNIIVGPEIRQKIIEERILVPIPVYQVDNEVKNIFVRRLTPGKYRLYFPILTLSPVEKGKTFKDSKVQVKISGQTITEILPYAAYHGINWREVTFEVFQPETLSINTVGRGVVVFGNPLLVPFGELSDFENGSNKYTNLPVINTYGVKDNDLEVKINGSSLNSLQKYQSTVEIDLLDGDFRNRILANGDFGAAYPENSVPSFVTKRQKNIINNTLSFNKPIKSLQFTIGSAFLDSEDLGKLLILSSSGKILYQSSIYQKDKAIADITIPEEVLASSKNIKIELQIDKSDVILYSFVIKARW